MPYTDILRLSPLFASLTEQDMSALLACLSPVEREYAKDSFIIREGDVAESMGLLIEGRATVMREDFWGRRDILSLLSPPALFAETFACLPGHRITVSVVAEEKSRVLWLSVAHALAECDARCACHAVFKRNLVLALAEKNALLNEKLLHLSRRSTREKLLSLLSQEAKKQGSLTFTLPFDRQQLADYLSVDRSALSQTLSLMQRDGLIRFHKNSFTLLESGRDILIPPTQDCALRPAPL